MIVMPYWLTGLSNLKSLHVCQITDYFTTKTKNFAFQLQVVDCTVKESWTLAQSRLELKQMESESFLLTLLSNQARPITSLHIYGAAVHTKVLLTLCETNLTDLALGWSDGLQRSDLRNLLMQTKQLQTFYLLDNSTTIAPNFDWLDVLCWVSESACCSTLTSFTSVTFPVAAYDERCACVMKLQSLTELILDLEQSPTDDSLNVFLGFLRNLPLLTRAYIVSAANIFYRSPL